MRKLLCLIIAVVLVLGIVGCAPAAPETGREEPAKILIAYFSRTGNTRTLAEIISESNGGNLFEIEPVVPYPTDLNETVTIVTKELADKARPEIASQVEDFDSYDVIFIGYPIWSATIPMIIATFLETYDFSGKTIVPFCTFGSGGPGTSMANIKALCPDATVLEGYSITGARAANAKADVDKWLEKLNLK